MEVNWVQGIFLISGMLLSAAAALLGSYLVFKQVQQLYERRIRSEMRIHAFNNYMQLVITAHERMLLYLERMQPESLLLRNQPTEHKAQMLEALMLREVQLEFEHNIVQQLYLAPETWRIIEKAKVELLQLIQRCTQVVGDEAPGLKLAEQIAIEVRNLENGLLLQTAINALKSDLRENFR